MKWAFIRVYNSFWETVLTVYQIRQRVWVDSWSFLSLKCSRTDITIEKLSMKSELWMWLSLLLITELCEHNHVKFTVWVNLLNLCTRILTSKWLNTELGESRLVLQDDLCQWEFCCSYNRHWHPPTLHESRGFITKWIL